MVSIPEGVSVNENAGMVEVCAMLSVSPSDAILGSDIAVTLMTGNLTGEILYHIAVVEKHLISLE